MSTVSRVLTHSVFQVERYGDTLVVIPQGDAIGFSPNRIQVELRAIEKLLDKAENRHLIIDLHRTNYFGSDMIGHISRIGIKARQTGGRLALCDVSADMQDIFNMMHFEQLWETFGTRRQALRSIASVPIRERLKPFKKIALAAVAIAALVAAAIYYPWPTPEKSRFDLFVSYATQWQQLQKGDKQSTNRTLLRKRVQRNLKPIMTELVNEANQGSKSAKYMYEAAIQGLMPLISSDSPGRHEHEDAFIENMAEAAKYIPGATAPTYENFGRQAAMRRQLSNGDNQTAERSTGEATR